MFTRFSVNLPSCVPLATVSLSLLASPASSLVCLQVFTLRVTFNVSFFVMNFSSKTGWYWARTVQEATCNQTFNHGQGFHWTTLPLGEAWLWFNCKRSIHIFKFGTWQVGSIPIVWSSGQGGTDPTGWGGENNQSCTCRLEQIHEYHIWWWIFMTAHKKTAKMQAATFTGPRVGIGFRTSSASPTQSQSPSTPSSSSSVLCFWSRYSFASHHCVNVASSLM